MALTNTYEVNDDQALELMAHHLMLASQLFQNISENKEETAKEVRRILKQYGMTKTEIDHAINWMHNMHSYYEDLKKDD